MTHLETLLVIFIIVTAAAVVIQMFVLLALYISVKRSSARMEALAEQVQTRAVPTLELAQSMLQDYRPKVETILTNVTEISTVVKAEVTELKGSVTDVVHRTHDQVARVDELVTKTLSRVENATEMVNHSVSVPVRHATGVLQGITTGLAVLFGKTRARRFGGKSPERARAASAHKDEMFI